MIKNLLLIILCFCSCQILLAQNYMQFIRDHALEIPDLGKLDTTVYNRFKPYEVFLIGEMHGTHEPAKFVKSLATLIVSQKDTVCVGLEIPASAMSLFTQNPNDSTLRHCSFFQAENVYGRNGQACFELIRALYRNPRIHLFFFDDLSHSNRDSMMFVHVLAQKKSHPQAKIITLSGNIHNWLKPFQGSPTLGSYLNNSAPFFKSASILSINHLYHYGTMMNNTGNGLELKVIEKGMDSIYSKALGATNYLCPVFLDNQNQYNWFLFTQQVTHSASLK